MRAIVLKNHYEPTVPWPTWSTRSFPISRSSAA
jgi:hypothetical protein